MNRQFINREHQAAQYIIEDMAARVEKQQTIQYLTELMATIANAHYKGRETGSLCIDEAGMSGIAIDLYDFDGDGHDFVEGLNGVVPDHSAHGVDEKVSGWVCNIGYDPDDEEPLCFMFCPGGDGDDYTILPDTLPADLLQNIAAWLEQAMQPVEQEEKKLMLLCSYDEDERDHGALLAVSRERFKNDPDAVRKAIREKFTPCCDEDEQELKECIDDLMQERDGYYGSEYYWKELQVLL